MNSEEVLESLEQVGAILEGHFVLSSGRHSDLYVEKFRALEKPDLARELGEELARRFKDRGIDVVLSPAVGALILGFVTAMDLAARFIFTEREEGEMKLRRGFGIRPGEKVLVVEDVITTGGSLREVLDLVAPGRLAGIGCLADRSDGATAAEGVESLVKIPASSWDPASCPLCARGIPQESPGSRHLP